MFSFKLRGAYNKVAHLPPDVRARGIICSSAGNHAQGVALAAKRLVGPHICILACSLVCSGTALADRHCSLLCCYPCDCWQSNSSSAQLAKLLKGLRNDAGLVTGSTAFAGSKGDSIALTGRNTLVSVHARTDSHVFTCVGQEQVRVHECCHGCGRGAERPYACRWRRQA